jgi:glyoxylase-like metal-dependent hydrolase (beta-lactamase superfamily II)
MTITVGPFAMNCYLLADEASLQAILIDPGAESERLIEKIEKERWQLAYIVNTHCHIDHTAEAGIVQKHFKVPFYIHRQEYPLLTALEEQGVMFGLQVKEKPEVTSFLQDGDSLQIGSFRGSVLYTPGHTPGGISLRFDQQVFVGDTLFQDSIGRTDLYGGNHEQLIKSITAKLLSLPDDTRVYPGHGPATTIGRERRHNPFLSAASFRTGI